MNYNHSFFPIPVLLRRVLVEDGLMHQNEHNTVISSIFVSHSFTQYPFNLYQQQTFQSQDPSHQKLPFIFCSTLCKQYQRHFPMGRILTVKYAPLHSSFIFSLLNHHSINCRCRFSQWLADSFINQKKAIKVCTSLHCLKIAAQIVQYYPVPF